VLFIATTNNIEKLSEKLKRPGRFDRKIEIPLPDRQLRQQYLEKKFNNKISSEQINRIVQLSEGLSFGHLREIVVSHCGYGVDLTETVNRLKKDMLNESATSAQITRMMV
jgi:ATP-dependent 26S proteasome regulatory subunit